MTTCYAQRRPGNPVFFFVEAWRPGKAGLLFANDRLGHGASTAEAAKSRSLPGWLCCEKAQKLCKLKMFIPAEEGERALEELFLSLRCP
jgi:hypothetical protein